jgi:hypothetical protein
LTWPLCTRPNPSGRFRFRLVPGQPTRPTAFAGGAIRDECHA